MNRFLECCLISTALFSTPASAQLFDGCPSEPILEKFQEFGETGRMPQDLGQWLGDQEAQYIEPWRAFDNVDYVGICWVSSWLIHTSDGAVLIDTLYGPFAPQLLVNIRKVGVELSDIKYVLMTHGHFDHVAGAAILKPALPNAQFVMTKTAWEEAAKDSSESQDGRRAWNMIEPELVVADSDTIELGGNTFTAYETPGHTWGTTSYTYDVVDDGETYRAITIGGLGLNAIEGPSQVEAYMKSVDRISALVENSETPVHVHLSNHGFSNHLEEDRKKLADREPGEAHVLVNPDALQEQIAALRKNAVARLEKEKER